MTRSPQIFPQLSVENVSKQLRGWKLFRVPGFELNRKRAAYFCEGRLRNSKPGTRNSELETRNSKLENYSTSPAFIPLRDHLVGATKYGPRTRAISLADKSFTFHDVENRRGAAVANAQSALQHRRRGALHLHANPQRFFKQFVVLAVGCFKSKRFLFGLRDRFVVRGRDLAP